MGTHLSGKMALPRQMTCRDTSELEIFRLCYICVKDQTILTDDPYFIYLETYDGINLRIRHVLGNSILQNIKF